MAGTIDGGKAAAKSNKRLYGPDFYGRIGRKGGSVSHPKTRPFAMNREAARRAGRLGGMISRRGNYEITPAKRQEIERTYRHLLKIQERAQRQRASVV